MSEQTPSQAEGERDDEDTPWRGAEERKRVMPPRTTPSQAEGEREEEPDGEGKS